MAFCSFSEGAAMFDVTPIENMFLLEYLPGAPADALRVYLYARMLCLHPELGGEVADIAKALSMEEDDVLEAFVYWTNYGLAEKRSDHPPTYALRMLHSESFHAQRVGEADRYKELRGIVNKLFEDRDYVHEKQFMKLTEWIEDLHYTEKAALRILEFEMTQPGGKKPPSVFKRADRRAIEWAERGIHTLEEVERAIRYAGKVSDLAAVAARQLSLYRAPTVNELECARRWVEELGVTEQDVLDACAETTKSRAPSFAYLDTILRKRKQGDLDAAFDQVKNLIDELGIIGTKPTPEQLRQYQGWLSDGFAPETILMAAVQCAQKGWNTFEKLNWMLENWGKADVRTHAQAQSYLADRQKVKAEAAEVLRRAGRSGEPGQVALDMYERWKARFPMELILFAADCARGKGKTLSYMDKLLDGWEKSGATTLEAARAQHAQRAAAAQNQGGAPRSMNYQQHSYTEADFGKDFFNDPTQDYPIANDEQEGGAQ